MKILADYNSSVSFQRAYTTNEKKEYKKLMAEAAAELNIKDTAAIMFDFNLPSGEGLNYGIGTLNSPSAQKFVDFLKDMALMTRIQTGPQSELDYYSDGKTYKPNTSPYSGSTFTIGKQTVSLERLAEPKYGSILDIDYIKSLDTAYTGDRITREYKTDYDYSLGQNKDGAIFQGLKKAYDNLKADQNNPLNAEFNTYKAEIDEDVEKDIIFEAIADEYHSKGQKGNDFAHWYFKDKFLFAQDESYIEDRKNKLSDKIDFLTFCQFIAEKQHIETKEELNKKGIKLTGDCLVCFSPKEVWANRNCFLTGWYTGGIDPFCPETNHIQPWGSPALNYDKLGEFDPKTGDIIKLGDTGELLYRKFKRFNRLYDGIRMDAFWQYVSPFIYTKDLEGKNVPNIDNKIIKIMEKAAIDSGKTDFNPDDYILELIGFNTEKGKELTKNIFPHVYSTAYAEYNENPKHLEENQGYQNGSYIIGATSHDNDSLVNMSRNDERRELHTPLLKESLKEGYSHIKYNAPEYTSKSEREKSEQDFRTAKTAEIFTAQKQYFTLPDFFGMGERINISGKQHKDNWSVRIPADYERFYYSQAAKGYAMNIPKAYEAALCAIGSQNNNLMDKLAKAAEILAVDGPMTTKEADELEKEGKLQNTLNYSC